MKAGRTIAQLLQPPSKDATKPIFRFKTNNEGAYNRVIVTAKQLYIAPSTIEEINKKTGYRLSWISVWDGEMEVYFVKAK